MSKPIMVVGANEAKPMLEILKIYMSDLTIIKYSFEDELRRIKGLQPVYVTKIDEARGLGFHVPGDKILPNEIVDQMEIIAGTIADFPEVWSDFSDPAGIHKFFNDINDTFEDIQTTISTKHDISKRLSVPFAELQAVHLAINKASSVYKDARMRVQKQLKDLTEDQQ